VKTANPVQEKIMRRKTLFLTLAALLLVLLASSKAQAWGCYHVGFTHVGYGGVQHYGRTGFGGYGGYGGFEHYGRTGYGGYHYGDSSYGGDRYGGYGGYHYGGYHYGGGYSDGLYGGYARYGFRY
jgi:hypothetical protein